MSDLDDLLEIKLRVCRVCLLGEPYECLDVRCGLRIYDRGDGLDAVDYEILSGDRASRRTNAVTEAAARKAKREATRKYRIERFGTAETWSHIRDRIWQRDGNVCRVCDRTIDLDSYECGHIVDRMCGGTDLDENLVVMCIFCNRLKPPHETREAYEAWVASGGAHGDMVRCVSENRGPRT